jgi:hypothetical protein
MNTFSSCAPAPWTKDVSDSAWRALGSWNIGLQNSLEAGANHVCNTIYTETCPCTSDHHCLAARVWHRLPTGRPVAWDAPISVSLTSHTILVYSAPII